MGFYVSPLVSVKETDLSTTIPGVLTSVGVLILRNTWKGPEKKKTLVTHTDDLIDMFGKPTNTASCYQDMFSALAFLKESNKLYCTRVMPTSASFAGTVATSGVSATFTPYVAGSTAPILGIDFNDPDDYGDETGGDIMTFIANSRGAWGNNIRIAVVCKDYYDAIRDRGHTTWTTYSEINKIDSPLESDSEFLVIVQALDQGGDSTDESQWDTVEVWNVSTKRNKVDDQGDSMFVENRINNNSKYIKVALNSSLEETEFKNGNCPIATSEWQTFGGGSNYRNSSTEQSDESLQTAIMDALDLYSNPEEIDVNLFIDSNKSDVIKAYIEYICSSRLDCVGILDCRSSDVINNEGNEAYDLCDYRRGADFNINSSYSALYGNWANIYDRYNSCYRWVPISGYVAAAYAKTDDVSDPWFAPAGLRRGILSNIRKLAFNPTLGERDIMYKNGINPIVSFAGKGKVIWGQKTLLDRESAFNRVNVRRLFIVLEKAISTSTQYFLFEPNDAFTRMSLVNMIEPYLRDIRGRRGIYDYYIVCDESNNTPERIDRNELWCDIYIKPTRAAEYIILRFIATKTGASFLEIAGYMSGTTT